MPGHTGEPITTWLYRVESWELGWRDATDARLESVMIVPPWCARFVTPTDRRIEPSGVRF